MVLGHANDLELRDELRGCDRVGYIARQRERRQASPVAVTKVRIRPSSG
jgi:hypothetical protein